MDKPVLSKQAFWDVDMDKINYEKELLYVIEEVLDWGTLDDYRALIKFYGKEKIGQEVINTKILGDIEINFCCLTLDLKTSDFKCNEKRLPSEKRLSRSNEKFKADYIKYLNC